MLLSIIIAFGAGLLGGCGLYLLALRIERGRLYSLESDVVDLQDRLLSSVRKAAANKRWQEEADLDGKIEALAVPVEPPKKEGWTKWAFSKNSS